jgi:hypothetical protein
MVVVARITGYSLLTAALAAGFGLAVFGHDPLGEFLLACVGAIVGAVAGAAGEIVTAQRRVAQLKPRDQISKPREAWE